MKSTEFNLLNEKWLRVLKPDNTTDEVSLLRLFECAHNYTSLAGELPAQDVAVLRLLLAVLQTVFHRNENCSDEDAILEAWHKWYECGAFGNTVVDYLKEYEDRFWLFDEKKPFYQSAAIIGTDYSSAKLNGEISESGNKIRLFPNRTAYSKRTLTYAEAARWLLYVNAYDDTSGKSKTKGAPSTGAGWLGKCGIIYALGCNLFETLMLNLVLVGEHIGDGKQTPVWEAPPKAAERTEIPYPDNQAQLLTLQSRRLLLKREEDSVIGYSLLGGDFFIKENAFIEQMTVWSWSKKDKVFRPRRHRPERQMWRDFEAFMANAGSDQQGRRPGVVEWLTTLKINNLIPQTYCRLAIAGVNYGDKDFFVDDMFSDEMSINSGLFTELGKAWIMRITTEINDTDDLVTQLGFLAQNIAKAEASTDGNAQRDNAKEQAYFSLDLPFRRWLRSIDPKTDVLSVKCDEWFEEAKTIVRKLGKEIADNASPQAFIGRKGNSAPQAYNIFLYKTKDRENLKNKREGK